MRSKLSENREGCAGKQGALIHQGGEDRLMTSVNETKDAKGTISSMREKENRRSRGEGGVGRSRRSAPVE